jgi:two-component system nitrogen regulation sensor histidine kinase NtrY
MALVQTELVSRVAKASSRVVSATLCFSGNGNDGKSCAMATEAASLNLPAQSAWQRRVSDFAAWLGHAPRVKTLEVGVGLALLLMAIATAALLVGQGPKSEPLSPVVAATLLVANLLPAAVLMMLIGRRFALRRAAKLGGGEGGLLHVRLVVIFTLLAAVPALLLSIFASVLFQSGVQFWFSSSAQGMLENAGALAEGYYTEQLRDVGDETATMADDIRFALEQAKPTDPQFLSFYTDQVLRRKLSESALVLVTADGTQRTLVVASPDERKANWIDKSTLERLKSGETLVATVQPDRVEAAVRMFDSPRTYLYASRAVTVPSFKLSEKAQSVLADYREMESRSRNLQYRFNALIYLVSLLIIGLAVWIALLVADRLVRPINDLVEAAQRIADGDMSVRVPEEGLRKDEVGFLSRSFNRMTERLKDQTDNLLAANRQIEERRSFIETILGSVSSGILSVAPDGRILLANPMAERLLGDSGGDMIGQQFEEVAPHLAQLHSEGKSQAVVQVGDGTEPQTLAVKLNADPSGLVVTFEDITRQLADQRRAAWSDVARRIAHEIKNPLTPIQLAAERLKRRFSKQVGDDAEIFEQLTGTIVRQVGDLRNIADEFSSFARMPKPVFREENLVDIVAHATFLFEVANPDIVFVVDAPASVLPIKADRRQLGQAATNIVKNAVESIRARIEAEPDSEQGRIVVTIKPAEKWLRVSVEDNGQGLPEARERILEPYVTTRTSGSGLGLAIVNKIIEEHQGELTLTDRAEGRGAVLTINLPAPVDDTNQTQGTE